MGKLSTVTTVISVDLNIIGGFNLFVYSPFHHFFRPNDTLHNYATTFVKIHCCFISLYGMCYAVIMVIVF